MTLRIDCWKRTKTVAKTLIVATALAAGNSAMASDASFTDRVRVSQGIAVTGEQQVSVGAVEVDHGGGSFIDRVEDAHGIAPSTGSPEGAAASVDSFIARVVSQLSGTGRGRS